MTDLFSRCLSPSPDALESRVGEETVILHLGNDTYYGLDDLGTRIWAMLRDGTPLPDIRDLLAAEFGVGRERIEADMRSFLGHLLDHDLLVDV